MQLPFRIGRYELLEFLGGGMSQVYRSRDLVIDRPVVVKILTPESCADAEAKARFLQEARIAGNIQHENIVSVFDFGEFEQRPYIVMEYLKGEDLRDAIRNNRAGNVQERTRIAADLASALEYIHRQGIIHRDIKPENVHLDPSGRVKLMDFGISKTANLSLTRTGMAMGTPFYMSPEQVAGRPTTVSVDIYAFGMLFYELLTGVRGISGESMEQVFFQILHAPLDESKMEGAGTPAAIRTLVLRCTAKNVEDRPQSMREVVEVLRGAVKAQTFSNPAQAAAPVIMKRDAAPPPAAPLPNANASAKTAAKTTGGKKVVIAVVAAIGILTAISMAIIWSKRVPAIPGMVYFEAGTFLAGPDKTPAKIQAYFMDDTEVTNAAFMEFCAATGCATPEGPADLPVVNVTIEQARSFAKWKGKRLPTQLEWERAARGLDGAKYPWGDTEDAAFANLSENPTLTKHALMPVRSFKRMPVFQMAGNAWEMVEGEVTPSNDAVAMFQKLIAPPGFQEKTMAQEIWIQIRGGSFNTTLKAAVTYEFSSIPERYSGADIGFRCAKSLE